MVTSQFSSGNIPFQRQQYSAYFQSDIIFTSISNEARHTLVSHDTDIKVFGQPRFNHVLIAKRTLVRTLIALHIFLSHFIDNQPSDPCGS